MRKKNVRIITKLKVEMNVKGTMTFTECKEFVRLNCAHGLTSNQLVNILAKGPDFDKVPRWERTVSILGSTNRETVWRVRQ